MATVEKLKLEGFAKVIWQSFMDHMCDPRIETLEIGSMSDILANMLAYHVTLNISNNEPPLAQVALRDIANRAMILWQVNHTMRTEVARPASEGSNVLN